MTTQQAAIIFTAGVLAAGYAIAALFFLKFWKQAHDRLFGFFAAAFALLTWQRIALAYELTTGGETLPYYIIRLVAFLLIVVAIIDKNRGPST